MKSNLNDKQKEAVNLGLGPALILAGPGSGKTTVILERIKHLIYELNISSKCILVITFTKSAALEMKMRAAKILKQSDESPFFGTFHSYFYSVLKRSYEYHNFSIMTTKQKYRNLENLLKSNYPTYRISNNFLQEILSCISKVKNDMSITMELERLGFSLEQFDTLRRTFDYLNREQKLMDFDDIILYALKLLKENSYILELLRKEVKYILVDEFQDVNKMQYELVSLLAGKNGNLFVVGDDDQSIYRFRGAGEENLRQFEVDFHPVHKVILDINYRCPKQVVSVSSRLISHNEMRFFKELCSGKNEEGKVICQRFISKDEERKYIVERIKEELLLASEKASLTAPDKSDKKTAILCRTNSQLSVLAEMLKKERIKFYMKEKPVKFYELPYIRPIIGYLMFAIGIDRSRKRLFTFLNQPMRYINRELFVNWDEGERRLDKISDSNDDINKRLLNLDEMLKKIGKMKPEIAISYILKIIGYEEIVLEKCKTKEDAEKFKSCVDELKERAKMYDSIREWMEYVKWEENADFFEEKEVSSVEANVFLYTFHGAKGLEFDTVFIPHLNEGSVPYGKNLTKEEIEEERRMFYVALTRSSKNLYVTYVENDTKKDVKSRFLLECGIKLK